ncbi:hypothetical protein CYY_005839 [Polysphondylium violaceum]|uniref:Succinate dehydrogenase assembly factor 3 n=1 Tax=Polysphondylium violaceum TaxID=133409 RepID=A0A8J4PSW1_9MYCE|nr:hypothetical protein CYY_005839 [Polysphondylium violaceum]
MSALKRGDFLKLYRDILRCHRILQEPMKSMGDQYVKNEWRLHKKVDSKVAKIFYEQWNQYYSYMLIQREQLLDSAMKIMNDTDDGKINQSPILGRELDNDQLKKMNKEQKEQLEKLKVETSTFFNPETGDANVDTLIDINGPTSTTDKKDKSV